VCKQAKWIFRGSECCKLAQQKERGRERGREREGERERERVRKDKEETVDGPYCVVVLAICQKITDFL
jgi:hypothetical protein